MALVVSPLSLSFNQVGVPATLTVTEVGFSGTFTATSSDQGTAFTGNQSKVTGPGPVLFQVYPYQAGSCTVTVSDGTNTVVIPVTVTLAANPLVAGGYTAAQSIAMVYLRTNENAAGVSPANVLSLLNTAIGEVSDDLGPVRKYMVLPTIASQNIINLPYDVQDVISASFSTLAPAGAGTQVYRLEQLEQNTFMDFSGGLPGTGFGPPLAYMVVSDTNGNQIIQLYPPAISGQINLYYRARPIIFSDTLNSTTNIDPQAQENIILWTCARIMEAREKYPIAKLFMDQYDKNIENDKDIIQRRSAPKSGQVRDVTSQGRPGMPPWLY